ncbi:MAG: tripartite tricarboxylate transporter substrate binding protein [Candidatus Parcubacteria bacterium]|nr:tripartite tricarboxylate transporter substrate binding protein [Burkholderiales bacterium]
MIRAVSLLLCSMLFTGGALAQGFPTKTIRIINPFAAGGFGEVIVRPMMDRLSAALGQPIVLESHAGANGLLAAGLVAKAAPDGHTILLANLGPQVISPAMQSELPYDPIKDFAPITQLVSGPLVLLVRSDFPAKTLPALIAHAKANRGKLSYASVGPASTTHLAAELINLRAGTDILHIPYKGATPAIADLLGGQVQMAFINISLARPQMEGGRLRGIAVSTLKRSGAFPELPTVAETLPGFEVNPWWGFMATGGTPRAIIARLHTEIVAILKSPDFAARLNQAGLDAEGSSPDEFAARLRADLAQWREIVKATGIKPN